MNLSMSIMADLKYDIETCLADSLAKPSAHFAQRRINIRFAQRATFGEPTENVL